MSNLTENETLLLKAILHSEFHDSVAIENRARNAVWVDCIWGKKKFGGTMASLAKKGLANTDGECCWLTETGLTAAIKAIEEEGK